MTRISAKVSCDSCGHVSDVLLSGTAAEPTGASTHNAGRLPWSPPAPPAGASRRHSRPRFFSPRRQPGNADETLCPARAATVLPPPLAQADAVCTAAATAFAGLMLAIVPAPAALAAASTATAYQSPGTPSPSVAGATTPFTTYQAPEGQLGGGASVVSLTSAPTSEYDSPQGEATGHAYVQLTGTGQSVQWTNDTGTPINFVNVRASIPDSVGRRRDHRDPRPLRQRHLPPGDEPELDPDLAVRGQRELQLVRARSEGLGRRSARFLGRLQRLRHRQRDRAGIDDLAGEGLLEHGVVLLGQLDRPVRRARPARPARELDLDHQLRSHCRQHPDQRHSPRPGRPTAPRTSRTA